MPCSLTRLGEVAVAQVLGAAGDVHDWDAGMALVGLLLSEAAPGHFAVDHGEEACVSQAGASTIRSVFAHTVHRLTAVG